MLSTSGHLISVGSALFSACPVESPVSPASAVHVSVLDPQGWPVLSIAGPWSLWGQPCLRTLQGQSPVSAIHIRSPEPAGSALLLLSGPLEPGAGVSALRPVSRDKALPCPGLALCPYPICPQHLFRLSPWAVIHRRAPHLLGSHLHSSRQVEPCSLQGGLSPSCPPVLSGQPPASPPLGKLFLPPEGCTYGEEDSLSSLPRASVLAGGWGGRSPEGALWVFRTSQLISLPRVLSFCLGAGGFSRVLLLLLGGRFLFESLSPQGTPVASSQMSEACCHPK